jgi:hypothetical protein
MHRFPMVFFGFKVLFDVFRFSVFASHSKNCVTFFCLLIISWLPLLIYGLAFRVSGFEVWWAQVGFKEVGRSVGSTVILYSCHADGLFGVFWAYALFC